MAGSLLLAEMLAVAPAPGDAVARGARLCFLSGEDHPETSPRPGFSPSTIRRDKPFDGHNMSIVKHGSNLLQLVAVLPMASKGFAYG